MNAPNSDELLLVLLTGVRRDGGLQMTWGTGWEFMALHASVVPTPGPRPTRPTSKASSATSNTTGRVSTRIDVRSRRAAIELGPCVSNPHAIRSAFTLGGSVTTGHMP
jgi:hypothetical protein